MKRSIAAVGLGALVGWLARRRTRAPQAPGKSDAQLATEARASIDAVVAPYVRAGAVRVDEEDGPPELCLSLSPAAPGAATVSLWVIDGQVGVGVESGLLELQADREGGWRKDLEEILATVAEGRYREEVSKGWLIPRRVVMRFPGTRVGSSTYATLTPGKAYGQLRRLGAFTYAPW